MMLTQRIIVIFFLMIRRPPRSTLDRSSAASDVYKRQAYSKINDMKGSGTLKQLENDYFSKKIKEADNSIPVSYTHLRAHETVLDLVCRLLLEKKKNQTYKTHIKYRERTHHMR